jgi:hypothetical protein
MPNEQFFSYRMAKTSYIQLHVLVNDAIPFVLNNSYKLITNTAWVRAQLCKLQKEGTRRTAASD